MFFKQKIKTLDDEVLVLRYKESGDPVYIGELFERYTHIVFLTCMKYLKDEMESEDVSMQIFEKLIVDLKKYEVKKFKYWLHTVVKNQCFVVLERKKRERLKVDTYLHRTEPEHATVDNGLMPSDTDVHELKLTQLEHALKQLGLEQRKCLELFYLQQKCYQEVSDTTGYDMKQVKSYIQNGKRNLKKHLIQLQVNE